MLHGSLNVCSFIVNGNEHIKILLQSGINFQRHTACNANDHFIFFFGSYRNAIRAFALQGLFINLSFTGITMSACCNAVAKSLIERK